MKKNKILIAPSGFKESISATAAAQAIEAGLRDVTNDITTIKAPLADGGSGTVDAILSAVGGEKLQARVLDPRGRPVIARYGLLADGTSAVIEIAASSGLALLSKSERNPMLASSYGTGQLILKAVQRGAKRIILGIGDSATVDGGIGALQALGVRLLDVRGRCVGQGGGVLHRIQNIDLTTLHPAITKVEFIIAHDVGNSLLGQFGAAAVFGPQKGATSAMIRKLDAGLANWAAVLKRFSGIDVAGMPGSGASGGLAIGFVALFGAKMLPGSKLIFEFGKLAEKLDECFLAFTAEGTIDQQTLAGKSPGQLALEAKERSIPLIAFTAKSSLDKEQAEQHGFSAIVPIIDEVTTFEKAIKAAPTLLRAAASRTFQLLLIGQKLGRF
ncbi:MAG: glycerate kinase [Acidobacteriota bacterium]|nr:glycerate kinase [Blastocatellia bacterium]MDW8411168.1 glycerate kinase [Acidobacteriota bacterium]